MSLTVAQGRPCDTGDAGQRYQSHRHVVTFISRRLRRSLLTQQLLIVSQAYSSLLLHTAGKRLLY